MTTKSACSAIVTTKGQLVVPAEIRRRFGIKPGTAIRFIERDGEILFQPVTREFIRSLQGSLRADGPATGDLLRDRAADRKREEKVR
jgi:AbrB family looped-hinge helix DNA binding protein